MAGFVRGGRPQHIQPAGGATVAGTLEQWPVVAGPTVELHVFNDHATEVLELFLTLEAATAGAGSGFIIQPGFGWQGDVEVIEFWTLTTGAGSFRALAVSRP